jgi:cobalamin biosynthesis Mg chelatase CobN
MSLRKINQDEAKRIANRISRKAFAHLIDPLEQQVHSIFKSAYDVATVFYDVATLRSLLAADVIRMEKTASVTLLSGHNRIDYQIFAENEIIISSKYGEFEVQDSMRYEMAIDLLKELRLREKRRKELYMELQGQILGKSAKAVISAWPEVKEIVEQMFNVCGASGIESPLEVVLGRFLPALPAPTQEEVQA